MVRPSLKIEKSLWSQGHEYVAGIDEVGRGSWAGPLVVAAVIFPQNSESPKGLADSKLLKPMQRANIAKAIRKIAVATAVVEISPARIDKVKIGRATHEAFRKVTRILSPKPNYCIIDAFYIKHFLRKNQQAIKNGDKICASIAAASVIAKVYRDTLMKRLHFKYPHYGFGRHKGYGTKMHQKAIRENGLSKIHRHSFNLTYLIL